MEGTVKFNTIAEDKEIFQKERLIFVEEMRKFKYGYSNYGLAALNTLESLYKVLIYAEHNKRNPEKALEFVTKFKDRRSKLIDYCVKQSSGGASFINPNGIPNPAAFAQEPEYINLINAVEGLYEEMLRFKKSVGMG